MVTQLFYPNQRTKTGWPIWCRSPPISTQTGTLNPQTKTNQQQKTELLSRESLYKRRSNAATLECIETENTFQKPYRGDHSSQCPSVWKKKGQINLKKKNILSNVFGHRNKFFERLLIWPNSKLPNFPIARFIFSDYNKS